MATILLSAVGAAVGGGFGGTVLGLSGAVIGRAVGATLGRVIDQRLLGSGSQAVETGRIDRLRLTGASEGAPIGRIWGRMRVAGQVIWATRFKEQKKTSGGGKGAPSQKVTEFTYSISLAIAVCEGSITRVGRVWADGIEVARDDLNLRVYYGDEDQLPDPKIEAVEGTGMAPSYRGIAYVVIEDLALGKFGNRVPQFSFEVFRPAQGDAAEASPDLVDSVRAVALVPGTGEYALATTPVNYRLGVGQNRSANINSPSGKTDFLTSVEALREELPNCGAVSLVVSWFGDDLRCGECALRPKVENKSIDGVEMPWRVSGLTRSAALEVGKLEGRPVYGGTPADAAVIEAIKALNVDGQAVTFYPFILMEQLADNGRVDPWTGADDQPALPWRGRITTSIAPGRVATPDRTSLADSEVAAFFGGAQHAHFGGTGSVVTYAGPSEWKYRRFILHYAKLCALAGGVDAFCIGSEMRGLTRIRGAGDAFPAVAALRQLAADVRTILGPGCKIGYAADWSEYSGYQTPEADLRFHLDPLWSDANIDFVGIDNYVPLSDWRDGEEHLDASWESIYKLEYLRANIAGGEGYDWYYAADAHRDAQIRTPIVDGAHSEPWVWRVKDFRNWWSNLHFDRIGGERQATPTNWVPQSKPIWFTEIGCAAIDKGTNEPNKFLDAKSSESDLPNYSNGRRDDLMQMQYLRAMITYWDDPAHNPPSVQYSGRMVDMSRTHVWAWDTRPYPHFPNNLALWSDGENYARGHWLNGRTTGQPLGNVVAEICQGAGLKSVDVSGLFGLVRGYLVADTQSARSDLQPLMLSYGFEARERQGTLTFTMRGRAPAALIELEDLVVGNNVEGEFEKVRASEAEIAGRVQLTFVEVEGDYEASTAEALFPDERGGAVAKSEIPLALTRSEGQRIVERWLNEARIARDGVQFALPPSMSWLGAGDVVTIDSNDGARSYRIDRAELTDIIALEGVRTESSVYLASDESADRVTPRAFAAPVPVTPIFLDLPLMTGSEVAHAPHLAIAASPWPGSVAVWASPSDDGYSLNRLLTEGSVVGETLSVLPRAQVGVWDRASELRVRMSSGTLSSTSDLDVLNGANLMAIGDGVGDIWELFQFSSASLVEQNVWDIGRRLRGQAGTDGVVPDHWPVGSIVVLIDTALEQIDLPLSVRGLARHYRIGSAKRGYDDPSFVHEQRAFSGIGLRPLSPCHIRAIRQSNGDLSISWVRRTRVDGDNWASVEVPLGEATERYVIRVEQGIQLLRQVIISPPSWTYSAGEQASDGVVGQIAIDVAQLSDSFGPGPFKRIYANG